MKKAVIFTEASPEIGLGHLRRCEALQERLEGAGFPTLLLQNEDPREFGSLSAYHLGVIDSYLLPLESYQHLSASVKKALFFDDTLRLDYPSGILLNTALGAERLNYPKKAGRILALGASYALLRHPFRHAKSKAIQPQAEKILLTLGGSARAISLLPSLQKQISDHFPHLEILLLDPRESPSLERIVSLMQAADLALSASGGTLYELAALGVPTIALQLVENQATQFHAWCESGAVLHASLKEPKNLLEAIKALEEPTRRAELSRRASNLIKKGDAWPALFKTIFS